MNINLSIKFRKEVKTRVVWHGR